MTINNFCCFVAALRATARFENLSFRLKSAGLRDLTVVQIIELSHSS
jgi:hypothetical protein